MWAMLVAAFLLLAFALYWLAFRNRPPVYVTLTTLPERITTKQFRDVVNSLQAQTVPAQLQINIPWKVQGKSYEIPDWLSQSAHIVRCLDVGPATKLLGGLDQLPTNSLVVVVDDDIIYRPQMLERLVRQWRKSPNAVCANQVGEHREAMGFAGYLIAKPLLRGIEKLIMPPECRLVDDTWLSWAYRQLGLEIIQLPGEVWQEAADQTATDRHPNWKELGKDTEREKMIASCQRRLEVEK